MTKREAEVGYVFTYHYKILNYRRHGTLSVFRIIVLKKTSLKGQISQERFNLLPLKRQKYKMFFTTF